MSSRLRLITIVVSIWCALNMRLLTHGQVVAPRQDFQLGVPGGMLLLGDGNISTTRTYQWFKNGELLPDATGPRLFVTNTLPAFDIYKLRISVNGAETYSGEVAITFARPGPARLLAHFEFEHDPEGAIADSTGTFHGSRSNTIHIPGIAGGQALYFNGTNSFVRLPFPSSELILTGTPYSIAFWTQRSGGGTVMSMNDGRGGEGGYGLFKTQSGFTWTHLTEPEMRSIGSEEGEWIHAAFVWNGFSRTVFLNGRVAARTVTSRPLASELDDDLFLGAHSGTNLFLRGAIDDFRIYNYALTSDEVLALSSTHTAPALKINSRASEVDLTWTRNREDSFRLEHADALAANFQWLPAPPAARRSGPTNSFGQQPDVTVTAPAPENLRFYRLRRL